MLYRTSADSLYFLISNAFETTIVDYRFSLVALSPSPKLRKFPSNFLDDYENRYP